MTIKTKTIEFQDTEIKTDGLSDYQFSGIASRFNTDPDGHGDVIAPGAYTKTLKDRKRPIGMYLNHDSSTPIGLWKQIKETDEGLYVVGELTKGHSLAENVMASLRHKSMSGLSIGYRVLDSEKQNLTNLLKEIDLVEVSVVSTPSQIEAQIGAVKNFDEMLSNIEGVRDLEKFFRHQFDLSHKQSKSLIACIKGHFDHRDDDLNVEGQRDVGSHQASVEKQLIEAISRFASK